MLLIMFLIFLGGPILGWRHTFTATGRMSLHCLPHYVKLLENGSQRETFIFQDPQASDWLQQRNTEKFRLQYQCYWNTGRVLVWIWFLWNQEVNYVDQFAPKLFKDHQGQLTNKSEKEYWITVQIVCYGIFCMFLL